MLLAFGEIEINTKGLPRIFLLRANPSYTGDDRTDVSILLDSCQRAAVAKWAQRLGVEVADLEPEERDGGQWNHTYEAVLEVDRYRVRVWTVLVRVEPAKPAEVDDPAASACPCGCTAAHCRCTDAEACVCWPTCPVCDKDGGE